MTFATIDCGSNSILLLVGEFDANGKVKAIEERMAMTRLGGGLSRTDLISEEAAVRTIEVLKDYSRLCTKHHVTGIAAIGTAALRQAKNSGDFIARVKTATGIDIEVITPEREAWLTLNAAAKDFGKDIVVVDIGGASTEFTCFNEKFCFTSVECGCVSLTEKFLKSDPPSRAEIAALRKEAYYLLDSSLDFIKLARPHDKRLIETGGTATTLMAMMLGLQTYDSTRVHGAQLKITDLRNQIGILRSSPLKDRIKLPGLIPGRADVILAGAELLEETMSILGYADATISDRGIKWGLFYERGR